MNKLTDLRYVIGIFFSLAGLIVLLSSFAGEGGKSGGSQINLYAGICYIVFGLGMWWSSRKPLAE